ncbi:MAG: tripartite tricarboxylate transporter substrate binding protein [Sulfuricaulis sp.]|nr:tripartite tricarboxylate transporter substrate binding protein [Sulfuricaulis sp.]
MFKWNGEISAYLIMALLASLAYPQAGAAEYPSHPIRIVVGYSAGGPNDTIARVLGQKLTEILGQQTIVDNRPGADGVIGTDLVAKSVADGHTLALVSSSHTINPSLQPKLPYDPVRDFAPVTMAASGPTVLVVHPSLPARSVTELIALARTRPGQLMYASSGTGGTLHLAGELFKSRARIDITHVPYKGVAPATVELLAGQVPLMFDPIVAALPHIQSGKLRALAVTSKRRSPNLPALPTMQESGVADFEVVIWYGLLAPAGTAPAVVDRLNAEIVKIVRTPEMKERLASFGAEPIGMSANEFAVFLKTDLAKWAQLVKSSGLGNR